MNRLVARRTLREEFGIVAAEIGMRHERDLRLDVETLHMHRGLSRDVGEFFGDGFGRTCVSAMKNAPLLVIISDSAAKSLAPGGSR